MSDIDDLQVGQLKPDPEAGLKPRPIEPLQEVPNVPDVSAPNYELSDDELKNAKEILTLRLEVKDLLKGNYSPKQLADWAKVRGLWTAVGAAGALVAKGCL